MDFEALAGYLPKLNASLHRSYLNERRRVHSSFRPYLDYLDEFTLRGGKRLRALLVLAGYHLATGRSQTGEALPAAVALENFQSWMLIHDDIIDHAEERMAVPRFTNGCQGVTERNGTRDPDPSASASASPPATWKSRSRWRRSLARPGPHARVWPLFGSTSR